MSATTNTPAPTTTTPATQPAAAPAAAPVPTPAPFQSASLYVGDLHNEVTEVFIDFFFSFLFIYA